MCHRGRTHTKDSTFSSVKTAWKRGVIVVFGIDADLVVLSLLAFGGLVAFLFRTGLLKEMLGSSREGGGLWKKLCTGATVITEGGGWLMDARYLCSTFFFSLFPKWQPVRSPEAIAAEAAAAEAQAAAEREARRVQAEQLVARAAQAVDQAEQVLRERVSAGAEGGTDDAPAEQLPDANPPPRVD